MYQLQKMEEGIKFGTLILKLQCYKISLLLHRKHSFWAWLQKGDVEIEEEHVHEDTNVSAPPLRFEPHPCPKSSENAENEKPLLLPFMYIRTGIANGKMMSIKLYRQNKVRVFYWRSMHHFCSWLSI